MCAWVTERSAQCFRLAGLRDVKVLFLARLHLEHMRDSLIPQSAMDIAFKFME
jgi:hypothetical protein